MLPDHDSGLNPAIGRRLEGIGQSETQFILRIAIDEPKSMHSLARVRSRLESRQPVGLRVLRCRRHGQVALSLSAPGASSSTSHLSGSDRPWFKRRSSPAAAGEGRRLYRMPLAMGLVDLCRLQGRLAVFMDPTKRALRTACRRSTCRKCMTRLSKWMSDAQY